MENNNRHGNRAGSASGNAFGNASGNSSGNASGNVSGVLSDSAHGSKPGYTSNGKSGGTPANTLDNTSSNMLGRVPRLMLVGGASGSGKTTMTCALLLALKNRGLCPTAFKCGPDYIDPMFHTRVLNVPSRNLDLFLCGENATQQLLADNAQNSDVAIIEGVMGLYDGVGQTEEYSSNHLARATATPEILVVNTRGQSLSLAAQISGYLHFLPNTIKGIIFNQTPAKMYPIYKKMVEELLGIKVYGYLPSMPEAVVESRSLGLMLPGNIADLQEKLAAIAAVAGQTLDIDGLLELARASSVLQYIPVRPAHLSDVTIGVARDQAFCFYYEDSLDVLRRLGAAVVYFSPLLDKAVPENISGLLIGGGYPEEHASTLANNISMLESLRQVIKRGMPVMAEGGGYLYLCRSLRTIDGAQHRMAGAIDVEAHMTPGLRNFGYCTVTAKKDTPFCAKGSQFPAHEFHYSDSSDNGSSFTARKANGAQWECIHAGQTIFAGFPQVHLCGCGSLAENFIKACASFENNHREQLDSEGHADLINSGTQPDNMVHTDCPAGAGQTDQTDNSASTDGANGTNPTEQANHASMVAHADKAGHEGKADPPDKANGMDKANQTEQTAWQKP